MTRYFSVEWNNLTSETQEEIIDSCMETLMEACKTEGEEYLKKGWHDQKPKTWQEAWVRINAIEWEMWNDYEKGKPDADIPTEADWKYFLEEHLKEIVENACYKSMHHFELEVEL